MYIRTIKLLILVLTLIIWLPLRSQAADPRFIDYSNGTIKDNNTGLVWLKNAECFGQLNLLGATDAANNLSSGSCGLSDGSTAGQWRVPSLVEMQSLIDSQNTMPALPAGHPFIRVVIALASYWTSTLNGVSKAWAVDMYDGTFWTVDKTQQYSVFLLPVRSSSPNYSVSLSPQSLQFPDQYIGSSNSKNIEIHNTYPDADTIGSIVLSGANSSDFTVNTACSNKSLSSNSSCYITVGFNPKSCGNKSASMTVYSVKSGVLTAALSGTACGVGVGAIGGIVRNAVTQQPLSGAAVTIGANGPYYTDAAGSYMVNGLTPATYSVSASKSNYDTLITSKSVAPNQSTLLNIALLPSPAPGFRVTSVRSQFSTGKQYYFLPGVSFDVTFTADVDWGGKTPSKIRFITSLGSYDVVTSSTTATKTLNIGSEFSACDTLQVVAIAADGSQSPVKKADFLVTKPLPVDPDIPLLTTGLSVATNGTSYSYNTTVNKPFIDLVADGVSDIPIFEKAPLAVSYIPEINFTFAGDSGKAGYSLKLDGAEAEMITTWRKNPNGLKNYAKLVQGYIESGKYDGRHFPRARIAGINASLIPDFTQGYTFVPDSCFSAHSGWNGNFFAHLATDLSLTSTYNFYIPATPPIPMYVKASLGVNSDFKIDVPETENANINGTVTLNPSAKFSGGPGLSEVAGLEASATGGMETDWTFIYTDKLHSNLQRVNVFFVLSARIYVLSFEREAGPYRWDKCVKGCSQNAPSAFSLTSSPANVSANPFKLITRDYLKAKKPISFKNSPQYSVLGYASETQSYSVATAPIVSSTYPVSASNLSSNGSNVNLLWLTDNTERSLVNRTMSVHAAFDGSTWSTPVPINDNGTADFNPVSITLADGTIVAAWEDVKTVLPEPATPEDVTAALENMTSQLEISTAMFNPETKTWETTTPLTDNLYLDRSPKLSGKSKSNLMLTWIRNEQNDRDGSAANPNELYYSLFNGTAWSTPAVAAVIPNTIKRYSAVYDGTTANVVLALDTVGDVSTLEDLELYRLTYNGTDWSSIVRLTNDGIIDDNPQLSLDVNDDVVMTWIKGNELSSVVNFDFDDRTVIRTEESYSTTLADFKQASTTDGKVAVIYADTTENNSSDLFGVFYDPVFELWGNPKQLTNDPETEKMPSIAFLGNETIIATYNRKLVVNPDGSPTVGALTDLYMLKYTMGNDLALEAGSLQVDPWNAAPESSVTLAVKAQNLGDTVVQNIPVSFYNGDPANGGTLIGTVTISDPFKPGDSLTMSLPWTLPAGTTPITVFAVIDPASATDTLNRGNNVISTPLALPDLTLTTVTSEKLGPTNYSLIVTVANIGGTASPATSIKLRNGSANGPIITTLDIPALYRFESVDVPYVWDASTTVQTNYTLIATVDEANDIVESEETNNSFQTTLVGYLQDIAVTPASLPFGTIEAGHTTNQSVTIRNSGTAPLTITSALLSGTNFADFIVTPGGANPCPALPTDIPAGISCTLNVSITPVSAGSKIATLTIASNDPDSASVNVPVSLTAVDTEAPTVVAFSAPGTVKKHTIPITLTTTDNVNATGWLITENSTPPAAINVGWLSEKPADYDVTTNGDKTLYAFAKDAAGNVSMPASAIVTVAIPRLSVTVLGDGSGTVTSAPTGISCTSATCSALFDDSSNIAMMPVSNNITSVFGGWSNGCDSLAGDNCNIIITKDVTITASFNPADGIRIGTPPYATTAAQPSLSVAFGTVKVGEHIQARALNLVENLMITAPAIFKGGYNADYTSNADNYTILEGTLTIGNGGSLSVGGLKIRPLSIP